MGLKGDIDEAKELWRNASPLMKLVIGVSLFLTVSSVTSLADVVFEWKGFILDALEFYRSWIADPVRRIARAFGLNYTRPEVDGLLVLTLLIGSFARYFAGTSLDFAGTWFEKFSIFRTIFGTIDNRFMVMFFMLILLILWLGTGLSDSMAYKPRVAEIAVLYVI